MSKLLIVIPAYNEEESIVSVVEELTTHYPQYDYVVVNDGSRDKTAAVCRAHGYRLIDLPVNLGLAGAFQTGLRYAAENGYDCAMQLDADGQHKPEFIAPMLEALEEGSDIVCAGISTLLITIDQALCSLVGLSPIEHGGEDGFAEVLLPPGITDKQMEQAQLLFGALRIGFSDIAEQYPAYFRLTIRKVH